MFLILQIVMVVLVYKAGWKFWGLLPILLGHVIAFLYGALTHDIAMSEYSRFVHTVIIEISIILAQAGMLIYIRRDDFKKKSSREDDLKVEVKPKEKTDLDKGVEAFTGANYEKAIEYFEAYEKDKGSLPDNAERMKSMALKRLRAR